MRRELNEHELLFVTYADVWELEVRAGWVQGPDLDRHVGCVWDTECFSLDLYTIDDEELTAAEAVLRWLRGGWGWHESVEYLKTFHSTHRSRDVPEAWRRARVNARAEEALARMSAARGPGWGGGGLGHPC